MNSPIQPPQSAQSAQASQPNQPGQPGQPGQQVQGVPASPMNLPPPSNPAPTGGMPAKISCAKVRDFLFPKMSRKDKALAAFILVFQTIGLICALWYLSDAVRTVIKSIASFAGLALPGGPADPQRAFTGLLLILFIANSLSQILVDFYTGEGKPRISAACRLVPILLGVIGYLHQL